MPRFTTRPTAAPAEGMPVRELLSRCHAAARMAARGDSYSTEDRQDMAADLLTAALAALPLSCTVAERTGTGRPADVLAYVGAALDSARVPDVIPTPLVPSFTALYGSACNMRRSIDRRRARDDAHAATAAAATFTPHVPEDAPEVRATPWGARRTAVSMLRSLGALGRYVDRSALWTAAYAAARSAAGLDSAQVADELELTHAAYRQHLSRAKGRLASAATYPVAAHAAALDLPDTARGVKPARSRSMSADLAHRARDWRTRPALDAPVTCALRPLRRGVVPPSWTAALPPATAARLAHAARLSGERTQSRTPDERARARMAAGLPPAVR